MNRKLGVQIITLLVTFLFIFTTLSSTVQSTPPIPQETLIVDINGNGDYTSIQDAIDNANPNDIIGIKEGVYRENNLEVHKKLTIVGNNQANTIIDCGGNNGFILDSSNVDIRNLKLTNPGEYAIYVKPDGDWCNISQVIIEAAQKNIGIRIRASSVVVSNCDIVGIGLTGTGIELQEQNNIIQDCNIYGFTVGVLVLIGSHHHEINNCNIFNNEIAVDIRIESHDNLVSNCNIYVNDLGIYIWQNSNNNLVYLNNFWKNDVDANAQGNNTWDNRSQGNYWDKYNGVDKDGDGLGDTPYKISEENTDRYPLTSMILPDEITIPTDVRHVTTTWDNTPSFAWSPSVYSKGVEGYYVKIDNNSETYVGDTTSWSSPNNISDGVHTFYVRAIGTDDKTSGYVTVIFSIDTMFIDTDGDGWSDEEEQQYDTDPYDLDNYPLDIDNDRIPDSSDTDDDNDGYNDDMEISYKTDTKNPNNYPTDTDGDKIPDEDATSGSYTGDVDDDDDSLIDTIETSLGSNPKNGSDTKKVYITGKPYYLVDVTQDGVYDILYEPVGETTTAVEKHNEHYLIDQNGDSTWDYIYNTPDGSVSPYEEEISPLIIWIPITLMILLIILIITLYFKRFKCWKYKELKKREEIIKPPSIREPSRTHVSDKDTVEMISQTKNLLQHIHQDVEVYMEQLRQLENKIEYTTIEEEKETTTSEEKTSKLKDISNIEEEVDELLSGQG
ncbi:MAG: right-handed parallel beta-helix repeat-containing protein [Thermoplasmatales archaeon]|nr:MAG: right-handed parallel beta-helix repeat-containing protein [Thermoplasmatales archaeon]